MVTINELLDLSKTIAADLFEGKTYPWEVLDEIKDFILKLGETLPADEYAHPADGIWRRSFPPLISVPPASLTTARRSATVLLSAAVPLWARTRLSATPAS